VSATDPPALEKAVQAHAVTIYPVAYPASPAGDGPDPQTALKDLGRLARISGGRLFRLPSEQALPGVLDEIVADLRAQYVLGFAPAAGQPGRLRKISVEVRGHGKVVVRHRVGYRLQR
jgi:Ca-activated chloride channel family protein